MASGSHRLGRDIEDGSAGHILISADIRSGAIGAAFAVDILDEIAGGYRDRGVLCRSARDEMEITRGGSGRRLESV